MKSGLEIAQEAALRPIADVAAAAGIEPDELEQFGRSGPRSISRSSTASPTAPTAS